MLIPVLDPPGAHWDNNNKHVFVVRGRTGASFPECTSSQLMFTNTERESDGHGEGGFELLKLNTSCICAILSEVPSLTS